MRRRYSPAETLDDLLAEPTKAAIYNRISLDKDADEQAVTRQNDSARGLADQHGWEVAETYTDNSISASKREVVRPAYEKMLADYRAGHFTVIVVYELDRLTRQPSQLEDWIREAERGELRIMTLEGNLDLGTVGGREHARIKASIARAEIERKGQRQSDANAARAKNGYWQFSRRPYGYDRVDGKIVIVESEAEVLREAYRRVIAGESHYAVAEDFNRRGIKPMGRGRSKVSGKLRDQADADEETAARQKAEEARQWTLRQLARTLDNSHNAGIVTYDGKRIDTEPRWEPIIERRVWDDYTSRRKNSRRAGGWSSATKHLMSGLAICGVCGARMLARPDRGVQVYSCTTGWCVSITGTDLDPVVEKLVLARLRDKKVLAALRKRPDTAPIEEELAEQEQRLRDLTDMLADGLLDRSRGRERAQGLREKIERLNRRLTAARAESPLTDLAMAGRGLAKLWEGKTVVAKRRVITELGLRVTVAKGKPGPRPRDAKGNRIPDLDRLTIEWIDQDSEDIAQSA